MVKTHNSLPYLAILMGCILLYIVKMPASFAMSDTPESQQKNWVPEVAEARQDIQLSKSVIEDVKSKEPFINIQQKKIWDITDEDESEEDFDEDNETDSLWLTDLIGVLAMVMEAALWIIPILLVLYIYRYREYCVNLLKGKGFKREQDIIPETLFGLDIRAQSLPDNIEQEASSLWQQKKYREAVSLLYRGSLASLFKQYQFELSPGATEQDCIRQIELSHQSEVATESQHEQVHETRSLQRIAHFKRLTNVWIEVAYAHRVPAESAFVSVCNGWNQQFQLAEEKQ